MFFSSKHKVYTTDSRAISGAEDASVEGKRYPTNVFGRFLIHNPCIVFLVAALIPFIFFCIGCAQIEGNIVYSLDGYRIGTAAEVRRSADKYDVTMDKWTLESSGAGRLMQLIENTKPRSRIRGTVQVRTVIDVQKVQAYCDAVGLDFAVEGPRLSNVLYALNLQFSASLDYQLAELDSFKEVCFTNDLEYGQIHNTWPQCAPPTSISQYARPTWNASTLLWHMDGRGGVTQFNFLPRVFVNPNSAWFFDRKFSAVNQTSTQMRTEFTLASSPKQSGSDYRRKARAFIADAMRYLKIYGSHPYMETVIGGEEVESIRNEDAVKGEGYKVGLAFLICFVISTWHCGTFMMGVYTAGQVIVVYFAACGLYGLIYNSLPLQTYSAIMWVMTFGMHGTLSMYDMFVFSGTMATKGRQNNLTAAQRMCFTMRRITGGVWLANILAIIIFAINTTSVFDSVRHFSILMLLALLWNMYCIALCTPAFVAIHHFYFSGRRRNLQKQIDATNLLSSKCRRTAAMVDVLNAVQLNLGPGEWLYALDDDFLRGRIGERVGLNKKKYKNPMDFFRQQLGQGVDKLRAARHDVTGGVHKLRKTGHAVAAVAAASGLPDFTAEIELAPLHIEEFEEIGPANPLGGGIDDEGGANERRGAYFNKRMVRHADIIHIPKMYTTRSEECWRTIREAMATGGDDSDITEMAAAASVVAIPPEVPELLDENEFSKTPWLRVTERLGVSSNALSSVKPLIPLVVRSAARAQDPHHFVGEFVSPSKKETTATAAAPQTMVEPDSSGLSLKKLRSRWANRHRDSRSGCCGLYGSRKNESPEARMQRLMRRKVRRQGYTLFERLIINAYVPAIHFARWPLTAVLVALFIVVCAVGSRRLEAAGLPSTLVSKDAAESILFARLDDTFGQRGSCTFCGPYYRPVTEYRTATSRDIAACEPQFNRQMNMFVDACGTCNGSNSCMDCANVPNGSHVRQCGGCAEEAADLCGCALSHDCPYCEWALSKPSAGGNSCSVSCTAETCGPHGTCNAYTGRCDCKEGFSGAACDACKPWLVPIDGNPDCTKECDAAHDSTACACDARNFYCTMCPPGKRGAQCDQDALECGAHGSYDAATTSCVCEEDWGGPSCNLSSACSFRGVLLDASESPTGASMCGCIGHWRGSTCQLCDCLNGGMCDGTTGECACVGTFAGSRCQSCSTACVSNGQCPEVPPRAMNIRACIFNNCTAEDIAAEKSCASCPEPRVSSGPCVHIHEKNLCLREAACWWSSIESGMCMDAVHDDVDETLTHCTCTKSSVWAGEQCDLCLAPGGAQCLADGTVRDCTGLIRENANEAIPTDQCGICGGDGMCRGCDGIPGSGLVFDACDVCGGNNSCVGASQGHPLQVQFLFDFTDVTDVMDINFVNYILDLCAYIRQTDSEPFTRACLYEDYVATLTKMDDRSLKGLHEFASRNGRMSEAVFETEQKNPTKLNYMVYRVTVISVIEESVPQDIYGLYARIYEEMFRSQRDMLKEYKVTLTATSSAFQPALAVVLSKQSLWFAVGIGMAVSWVFLLVFFVSVSAAVGGTLVAGIVCFGTLTVCAMLTWRLDAVMQVCVSCTVPLGVEYVVHLSSGYFDYLQTTTSHLFARNVTRRTAVLGALLRSLPAVCSSAVTVIIVSIMFVVSDLIPSKRSGQVCITMHLILLIATVLYSGTMAAVGPVKAYQHWTLSAALCLACAVLAAISVVIIYKTGGVLSPAGERILY